MPKTPGPAMPKPPASPEERAESRALARAHASACRAALIAAGWRSRPPRRRHCKVRPAEDGAAEDGAAGDPGEDERALAAIAQGLVRHCRRGDCRRDFTCRFGARPGEAGVPPCLDALPKEALMALRLAALRMRQPEAFRDARLRALETAAIRRRGDSGTSGMTGGRRVEDAGVGGGGAAGEIGAAGPAGALTARGPPSSPPRGRGSPPPPSFRAG
ncbi:hypothetical protein [Aurantimonas sp. 22II-16-19i]|uniref:hypothetical protein n=1 Tax=Aurantimonas sp. 22II-16-19i TaxID=1317114 RepID=UPI0009F7E8A2|nr:hypothetical protein [Aurantimonas sp. 22II-16-19i]ORE93996.1 hypothetical protein ATO4_14619 [Aurantimonas sp. 22II-16-19i]